MTNFLLKRFVHDYENIKNADVRSSYGMFAGVVGIICNLILFAAKFFAGILTGAVSISADALNNLSDAGSSVVTLVGFKMAGKPADTDHPFGHGRIEYIAGLIVAAVIIAMALELFRDSIDKILHPVNMEFHIISIVILVGSIFVKMWLAVFHTKLGKKIDSSAMLATATDSMSDCIATGVVLLSMLILAFTRVNIDGFAGVIVAVFVFMAGIEAAKETIYPLLGQPPEPEFVQRLKEIVTEDTHIIGIHDLIVHNYGPGRVFASLHAEVPYKMDMIEAHDIIDEAEKKVEEQLHCGISIHMDPVVNDDEEMDEIRQMVADIIHNIDTTLHFHDFRMTKQAKDYKVIFDLAVPFQYRYSDEELKTMIADEIKEKQSNCQAIITVERLYANMEI